MDADQLLQLDAQRRRAMIEADASVLDRLLADDLTWTHSSGTTETKQELVAAILDQNVVYEVLTVERDQVRSFNDSIVHNGLLRGQASRNGTSKTLAAKFVAVWVVHDESMQLIAWQSTNIPSPA